jgi:hypothetical protein
MMVFGTGSVGVTTRVASVLSVVVVVVAVVVTGDDEDHSTQW